MCDRLYNTDTGEEIETQIGMMLLVGIDTYRKYEPDPEPDRCLCDVEYEPMLQDAGYVWHPNGGDPTDLFICHKDGVTLNPAQP